jgi:adenylate kinase family enzyme
MAQHESVRRVVILGPVGAGKSTLAARIAERRELPVVHLDLLFWRSGWTPAPREEAVRALGEAVRGDRWILDGNFLPDWDGGWDARFDRGDTVIFLDLPRRTCLWRVVKRAVRERGRSRPDLPPGCSEGLGLSVLRWIWSYPSEDRPRVLAILDRLDDHVAIHHLRSGSAVRRFVDAL